MTGLLVGRQTLLAGELSEQFVARDNCLAQGPSRLAAPIRGQSTQILLRVADCRERPSYS